MVLNSLFWVQGKNDCFAIRDGRFGVQRRPSLTLLRVVFPGGRKRFGAYDARRERRETVLPKRWQELADAEERCSGTQNNAQQQPNHEPPRKPSFSLPRHRRIDGLVQQRRDLCFTGSDSRIRPGNQMRFGCRMTRSTIALPLHRRGRPGL